MTAETTHTTPRRRARLLWTVLGAMVLVGLLPLVISHYVLIRINRDSLETQSMKYLTRSALSISTEIQNVVVSNTQQLTKIAGSVRAIKAALPAGTDPFIFLAQSGVIRDFITPDSDLLALRILNAAGQGAEAKPTGLDKPILDEMDLTRTAALQGQVITGTFQNVSVLNQPAVLVAVPVTDGDQVIGVVQGLVSLKRVGDRLREDGRGGITAFVVDRNGRVLMHSEPSVNVDRPDYSSLKIVQEFAKAAVRLTESYTDMNGVRVLGTIAPVGRPDWGVVVQQPESQAFASVSKMERATLEWGAIALGLAVIVAVAFASGIARPVRLLAERTREIANGNYEQRVDVKTHNEI